MKKPLLALLILCTACADLETQQFRQHDRVTSAIGEKESACIKKFDGGKNKQAVAMIGCMQTEAVSEAKEYRFADLDVLEKSYAEMIEPSRQFDDGEITEKAYLAELKKVAEVRDAEYFQRNQQRWIENENGKRAITAIAVGAAVGTAAYYAAKSGNGGGYQPAPQHGNCDYTWQIAADGSRCGNRAASVRPGGYVPPPHPFGP